MSTKIKQNLYRDFFCAGKGANIMAEQRLAGERFRKGIHEKKIEKKKFTNQVASVEGALSKCILSKALPDL